MSHLGKNSPSQTTTSVAKPVLLVDDESQLLRSTSMALRAAGISPVETLSDSRKVMSHLENNPVAAALIDLNMPYLSGLDLLKSIGERFPEIPVIILTAANELETAVECMRHGAMDYLVKPVERTRLISAVRNALEKISLKEEVDHLTQGLLNRELINPKAFDHIISDNEAMHNLFCYTEAISKSAQPILVGGETGTGKELFARAIHQASGREGEFIAVTVSGLDDTTFSDTLFGHKKGAFTGADSKREGLIASAQGGTLFLDEIGDLSMPSQVKLLRLLQEKEYYPLGEDSPKQSSARVVVATNVDLPKAIERGDFRQDLFYRLRHHHIQIPALRDRLEDLPGLVELFVDKACKELGRNTLNVPVALYQLLGTYHFPGNVRELEGLVFDAVARQRGQVLSLQVFKDAMGISHDALPQTEEKNQCLELPDKLPTLKEAEEQLIQEALTRADGNQGVAAGLLGITRQALNKRLVRSRDAQQN